MLRDAHIAKRSIGDKVSEEGRRRTLTGPSVGTTGRAGAGTGDTVEL